MLLLDVIGSVPALKDPLNLMRLERLVIALEPFGLEQPPSRRHRALVVLRFEVTLAHFGSLLSDLVGPHASFVKQVFDGPIEHLSWTDFDLAVLPLDKREFEHLPIALLEQVASEILHMEALGDVEDPALLGIVETTGYGAAIPVDCALAGNLRMRIISLERVIHDDEVAAKAREGTLDRGGTALPASRCLENLAVALLGVEASARKDAPVPICLHQLAAIKGKLLRKALRI